MTVDATKADTSTLSEAEHGAINAMLIALQPLEKQDQEAVIAGLFSLAQKGGSLQSYWHAVCRAAPIFRQLDTVCEEIDPVVELVIDATHVKTWILTNLA